VTRLRPAVSRQERVELAKRSAPELAAVAAAPGLPLEPARTIGPEVPIALNPCPKLGPSI
jgi:hypothetical protein